MRTNEFVIDRGRNVGSLREYMPRGTRWELIASKRALSALMRAVVPPVALIFTAMGRVTNDSWICTSVDAWTTIRPRKTRERVRWMAMTEDN